MMNKKPFRIDFSKKFNKQLKKAPLEIKKAFLKKLNFFNQNPFHPLLNNHALRGELRGYRSINITGDLRALYRQTKEKVLLEALGTHSELYE